jgi:uncharacterized protein YjbI with pentapeptide repeats
VTSLSGEQLIGANLRDAILPEGILQNDHLATVGDSSRRLQTLLLSILGACSYAWLTIWTTTDTGLLTNRTTSTLPVIGGTVPIGIFYAVMPLVLLGWYLYLLFELQHLWEGLARLPAVFPDGRPLNQRVNLGLLSSFLRIYWPHFNEGRGGPKWLFLLQKYFSVLLVWGVVPITLALFWGRYLARHDPFGTVLHIILLMCGIGAVIAFRHLMAVTLSSKQARSTWDQSALVSAGVGVIILALLGIFSFGAIRGFPDDQYTNAMRDVHWRAPAVPPCKPSDMRKEAPWIFSIIGVAPPCNPTDIRIVVPWIFNMIGVTPFANFEKEVMVALKPASWTGEKKAEVTGLDAVDLRGRNLQYAKAYRAFLAGVDLRGADLTGANLLDAKMHGANLETARLGGANLRWTKLRWSRLLDAKLTGAVLINADLREADLCRADLRWANLMEADLRGANLEAANLQWANLTYTKLEGQIASRQDAGLQFEGHIPSTTLEGADLSWANLSGAQLQATNLKAVTLRWATLTRATLQEAHLERADLRGADLFGANLWGANLFGADLREATLMKTTGLTSEQLEQAIIDESTILPNYPPPPET